MLIEDWDVSGLSEKERYRRYLCSRKWGERREAVRRRCDDVCERCRGGPMAAVHHMTYARKYRERLDDLIGVCEECHEFIHAKTGVDPVDSRVGSTPAMEIGRILGSIAIGCYDGEKIPNDIKDIANLMLQAEGGSECVDVLKEWLSSRPDRNKIAIAANTYPFGQSKGGKPYIMWLALNTAVREMDDSEDFAKRLSNDISNLTNIQFESSRRGYW